MTTPSPYWALALALLWLAPLAPRALSALSCAWRAKGEGAALFALAALALALYAYPSSADKGGGGTNTPPPVAAYQVYRVNLFSFDRCGRLVPVGVRIWESQP